MNPIITTHVSAPMAVEARSLATSVHLIVHLCHMVGVLELHLLLVVRLVHLHLPHVLLLSMRQLLIVVLHLHLKVMIALHIHLFSLVLLLLLHHSHLLFLLHTHLLLLLHALLSDLSLVILVVVLLVSLSGPRIWLQGIPHHFFGIVSSLALLLDVLPLTVLQGLELLSIALAILSHRASQLVDRALERPYFFRMLAVQLASLRAHSGLRLLGHELGVR